MYKAHLPSFRNFVIAAGSAFALGAAQAQTPAPVFLPTVTTLANAALAGFGATLSAAVMDAYGNIYVTDTSNNVIRRIDPTGASTIFAGGATAGCAAETNLVGDGCAATQAVLNAPSVVRIYKGDFYILDVGASRVRVVSGTTGIITTYAGDGSTVNGVTSLSTVTSCMAGATGCGLKSPVDMVFDSNGNLYVLDAGGTPLVQRIDGASKVQTYFAGSGAQAITGDGLPGACPPGTATAKAGAMVCASFNALGGVTADAAGNIYISEGQSSNGVRLVPLQGTVSTYVGISGTGTAGLGTDGSPAVGQSDVKIPLKMAFDTAGNLYIADSGNFRIRKVAPGPGGIISTVVGSGVAAGTTNGQTATQAALGLPVDVEITPSGDLLIVDRANAAVLLSSPAGRFATSNVGVAAATQTIYALTQGSGGTFAVTNSPDFTVGATTCAASAVYGATGTICQATLTFTPSVAGQRRAAAVFTDTNNASVASEVSGVGVAPAVSVLPGTVTLLAGTGTAGSSGDGGAATAAQLKAPMGAAVDAAGNSYIADSGNHTIRRIAANGTITTVAGTAGAAGFSGDGGAATSARLNSPSAVAVDGAGNLYLADTGNNRVRVVSAASGTIATFAGTGTAALSGDGGAPAAASLNAPSGLALGVNGVLYIADTANNVVRVAGLRGGTIGTVAGNGSAGFSGDTHAATAASLNGPSGLAVDTSGVLSIADTNNNVIRSVSTLGVITTVAGSNAPGYNGDGLATQVELNAPRAVAVDAGKNLYIADTANNRIRVVTGGALVTVGGNATAGASGDGGISTAATFNTPQGIALDNSGNLVVVGTGSNKVRSISASAASLTFPKTNPTSTSPAQTERAFNTGNVPLALQTVTVPAGFVQQASGAADCSSGSTVSVGSSCVLQLAFNPAAVGPYTGNVVLTDNAQGQAAATQRIAVTGTSAAVFTATFTTGLPATVIAGASQTVTVTVSNPAATYMGTLHFASSDAAAVLPADYTFTAKDAGTHTFTAIQLKTSGVQTLTVTDTVDNTVTATTSTTVTAAALAKLTIVSGNSQSVDLTASFKPFSVLGTDAFGNAVPNIAIVFTAPAAGASLTFVNGTATDTETTGANGVANSSIARPVAVTGTYSVQASSGGVSASFTVANVSSVAAGFALSPSSMTAPYGLQPGGSESVTLTLTPVGGFFGTVALTCSAPANSTCALSPSSLPPTVGTPSSFQLTLTTVRDPDTKAISRPVGFAIVGFGLGLIGLRRRKKMLGLLVFVLSFAALSTTGCGGGTLKTSDSPYGPYVVTVTATAGAATSTATVTFLVPGA